MSVLPYSAPSLAGRQGAAPFDDVSRSACFERLSTTWRSFPIGTRSRVERAEWNPVEKIVTERLGAQLCVHHHPFPGANHGREFVPTAHYLLEVTAEEDQIDSITEAIDPLIDAMINKNIHTNTVLAGPRSQPA